MDYKKILLTRGKLLANPKWVTKRESEILCEYINQLEELLDSLDDEDTFGTEGWRHRIGFLTNYD
jgi:hypothetical protein